jgi:hypothetical protein
MFVPVLQRMRNGIDALVGPELPSPCINQPRPMKIPGNPGVQRSMVSTSRTGVGMKADKPNPRAGILFPLLRVIRGTDMAG